MRVGNILPTVAIPGIIVDKIEQAGVRPTEFLELLTSIYIHILLFSTSLGSSFSFHLASIVFFSFPSNDGCMPVVCGIIDLPKLPRFIDRGGEEGIQRRGEDGGVSWGTGRGRGAENPIGRRHNS